MPRLVLQRQVLVLGRQIYLIKLHLRQVATEARVLSRPLRALVGLARDHLRVYFAHEVSAWPRKTTSRLARLDVRADRGGVAVAVMRLRQLGLDDDNGAVAGSSRLLLLGQRLAVRVRLQPRRLLLSTTQIRHQMDAL